MNDQKGFTLVELMAVIIILGIMFAVATPKIISLSENAEVTAVNMAIVDLNGRELDSWTKAKFTNSYSDQKMFDQTDYTLRDHEWISIDRSGGSLRFKETTVRIDRRQSATHEPAKWSLQ